MSLVYLVRKKVFRTAEGVKQLYYAVQRMWQQRGGVTTEVLAQRMAFRKGMSAGDVEGVLVDLPRFIEEALRSGESVTVRGLGSFHVAVTSDGFEHPDDVMPGKVRLSRVYFRPDKSLVARLDAEMDFYRYPLGRYFPHEMLRPETLEKERAAKDVEEPDGAPAGTDDGTAELREV
ncbi:HU family DNA-binding protein [Bacteroides helcogenes]|uniref:DNA-binding protein n=1 Tax=Bacteroides helcogenes (strain ATCC 35417 / DSM 20613 / JCM 6297 / CCUG 15421 / P 36-108) TaxID=693979 RepID=E6STG9_BACT6|nr:HU family DNA-binding protein [Bacteroides helcogenes]ADV43243.1 DNA-binding protein [Bacteroides helcogenes P 36-108]MDY5238583.1 HU family DNA-binding protein [Bacteroides helcogenes]